MYMYNHFNWQPTAMTLQILEAPLLLI